MYFGIVFTGLEIDLREMTNSPLPPHWRFIYAEYKYLTSEEYLVDYEHLQDMTWKRLVNKFENQIAERYGYRYDDDDE